MDLKPHNDMQGNVVYTFISIHSLVDTSEVLEHSEDFNYFYHDRIFSKILDVLCCLSIYSDKSLIRDTRGNPLL